MILSKVEVVPQGYRPYCGLNTLVMVARYLGLHLDEDWLAVAGKFQNTGSAAGSDMLGLYSSVAREARFNLNLTSDYYHEIVRRSIRAGMPVIVGYNDERQEVIFLESWEGMSKPRRMLVNEISHTADLTFSFRP